MHKIRGGTLCELNPEFKRRESFATLPKKEGYEDWSMEDVSNLGKCVVVYSSPDGPLKTERDINIRLIASCERVGISEGSRVYDEVINTGWLFLRQTHEFYAMTYTIDYELWISSKMQLHQLMAKMRSPVGESKVTERISLSKIIEDMAVDVQRLEARVFSDMTLMLKIAEHITGDDTLEGYAEAYVTDIGDLLGNMHEIAIR